MMSLGSLQRLNSAFLSVASFVTWLFPRGGKCDPHSKGFQPRSGKVCPFQQLWEAPGLSHVGFPEPVTVGMQDSP